jgi:hypothetical protein
MNQVTSRLLAVLAIAAVAVLAIAGSASAALSVVPTRTFGMTELFDVAPDGTLWYVSGSGSGSFGHTDDEGNNLGDGFSWNYPNFIPRGVGYYGNRLYMTGSVNFGHRLVSYQANSSDPGHDFLPSDTETDERIGGNQAMFRMFDDGGMAVALGQENKIGILDGKGLVQATPYYPQAFHGAGINDYYDPAKVPYGMESCVLSLGGPPVGGEPEPCGTHNGYNGTNAPQGFAYPNDVAPGLGGFYVSEKDGDRIKHINTVANPGATVDFEFGIGPGSGAGQLEEPQSIVRQPSTGYLYVSEGGNRRISVFDAGGGYIASFGYGVLTGADQMEVCGIEIGPCRAGVEYSADPRSYFSRLDFGPSGELYAYMALPDQIQVFDVSGGPSAGGGGGGGTAGGGGGSGSGTPPSTPATEKDKIRIKASPLKVPKGKKTKLTAIVNPPATCGQRLVLFQKKDDRSWDNLGKAIKPGKGCTASKRVKVTAKSVFRAVLIRSSNHATLAYSPNLTVKLK